MNTARRTKDSATIGKRGQIDFVAISSPWRKLWRNCPQSIYKCTAYLSAEAPLMALQKMPIGAALGWRPARRFTQIDFVPLWMA